MVAAFIRLLAISIGATILAVLGLFAIRQIGLSQSLPVPPHAWFQHDFWQIIEPNQIDLCRNGGLSNPLPKGDWITAVPVRYSGGRWRLSCPGQPILTEVLAQSPRRDWLLAVEAPGTENLDALVADLAPLDQEHRFAVFVPAQRIARYLRKKAPQWLFAADIASLVRLQLFTSLWIETAMDFWPDFVIPPPPSGDSIQISPRLAAELKRRHKKIVWKDSPDYPQPPPIPTQGLMTNRPTGTNP